MRGRDADRLADRGADRACGVELRGEAFVRGKEAPRGIPEFGGGEVADAERGGVGADELLIEQEAAPERVAGRLDGKRVGLADDGLLRLGGDARRATVRLVAPRRRGTATGGQGRDGAEGEDDGPEGAEGHEVAGT